MKKSFLLVAVLLAAGIGAVLGGFLWWNGSISSPGTNPDEKRIVIKKGASAQEIGNLLEEEGVVKSSFAFKIYLQLNNLTTDIPPGQFQVPGNLDLKGVVDLLLEGPTEVWVTIPEGYRREQVAERVANGLGLSDFAKQDFVEKFLDVSEEFEGYLFPDTYLFPPDITPGKVVEVLTQTFDKKFPQSERDKLSRVDLSLKEAVVLASIIERETINASERPLVAGILLNRIDAGWPLQTDATLQYITGTTRCIGKIGCEWWTPPTVDEKALNSPYNTYLNVSLPPAPISNPGETSLLAVSNPERSDYWFYIHDESGTIHYAETLEEHNTNIARYLR